MAGLADRFDAFLIDLDGVVYVGDRPLPGAPEAIDELRRRDKRLLFLTNDPRGSRDDYARRLRDMGVAADPFYATNRDATFPMPDGPWPASGSIVAAVEAAAGRRACAVGKPEPHMFEAAGALLGKGLAVGVVGDSPDSDIEGGRRAGLATILVTTDPPPARTAQDVIPSLLALVGG